MAAEKIILDRSSSEKAAAIIETLLPNIRVRNSYLELLASEIERVSEIAPSAWGLTLRPAQVRLNAGPIEVLTLVSDCIHVIVHTEHLSFADRTKFEELGAAIDGPTFYTSVPGSVAINMDADSDKALETVALLRRPALSLIEIAVKTRRGYWRRSSWGHAHSPGVIDYAPKAVGRDLPSPGYVQR